MLQENKRVFKAVIFRSCAHHKSHWQHWWKALWDFFQKDGKVICMQPFFTLKSDDLFGMCNYKTCSMWVRTNFCFFLIKALGYPSCVYLGMVNFYSNMVQEVCGSFENKLFLCRYILLWKIATRYKDSYIMG